MESEQERTAPVETPEDAESLRKALVDEKAAAERYLNNWRRAEADFDNYRKRVEQEKAESAKYSNAPLILSLLPVLNDIDRALNVVPPAVAGSPWIEGISLIRRKLMAIFEARGVAEIKSVGEQFDPAVHEALMTVEGEEGKVVAELQKGYKMYDRVIRPAQVTVGSREGMAWEKGQTDKGSKPGTKPASL
ncbi:MAG: nucleotide exchange factor GrpE [Chloroflexi bacterium]|nr:nucleotide exchange factor GrpE [Chloroflexota bacterium]